MAINIKLDLEDTFNWCVMWIGVVTALGGVLYFSTEIRQSVKYDCKNDIHKFEARYDTQELPDSKLTSLISFASNINQSTSRVQVLAESCMDRTYLFDMCTLCGKKIDKTELQQTPKEEN